MAITEKRGSLISVMIASASPHEVRLVELPLAACFVSELPVILIGDKAYDSDPLDALLLDRGIDLVAPDKKNRKKPGTQDGRRLRANYLGFLYLACIRILMKYL